MFLFAVTVNDMHSTLKQVVLKRGPLLMMLSLKRMQSLRARGTSYSERPICICIVCVVLPIRTPPGDKEVVEGTGPRSSHLSFSNASQGLTKSRKVSQGPTRTHEVPQGHKVSQGLTRTHNILRILQNFTRSHEVEQGLTRTHRISQESARTHKYSRGLTRTRGYTRSGNVSQGLTRCRKVSETTKNDPSKAP